MKKDRNPFTNSKSTTIRNKVRNEVNYKEMSSLGLQKDTLACHVCGSEDSSRKHYLLTIYELYVFRTVVCSSHLQGKCKNSDSCPFSHCLTWQRRNPNDHYYSPKLCPEICFVKSNEKMNLIRRCKKGKLCTFAHSKEEQLYHPLMYKTKECSLYPNCNRYYCPFSHGAEQIRSPEEVRRSIEEIAKSTSQCVLKDPYSLLSNIVNSGGVKPNIETKNGKNNINVNTNTRKETFLKSSDHNRSTLSSSSNFNNVPPRVEEDVIDSIWDTVDNWNLNTPNLNFDPTFMDIMSFNEHDQHLMNSSFNPCSFNGVINDNKYDTDYDQIWKEISTEYGEKKL